MSASKCKFKNCIFYDLNLDETLFENCILKDCEFQNTSLKRVIFKNSNLQKSHFHQCKLAEADFTSAKNYFISIERNDVKKAKFSMPEALSLIEGLGVIIE